MREAVLDESGHVTLRAGQGDASEVEQITSGFREFLVRKVEEYGKEYPRERWSTNDSAGRAMFGPGHDAYCPHVTIGRAFGRANSVPEPLVGSTARFALPSPVEIELNEVLIAHYAHRSYLRTVGEVFVRNSGGRLPHDLLCQLGISNDGQ